MTDLLNTLKPPEQRESGWYTIREIAEKWGRSVPTVQRLAEQKVADGEWEQKKVMVGPRWANVYRYRD